MSITYAILGFTGLFISLMNWGCVWISYILRKKTYSWVPFMGGILLAVGIKNCLSAPYSNYAWVALLIDPGCFLLWIYQFKFWHSAWRKNL